MKINHVVVQNAQFFEICLIITFVLLINTNTLQSLIDEMLNLMEDHIKLTE